MPHFVRQFSAKRPLCIAATIALLTAGCAVNLPKPFSSASRTPEPHQNAAGLSQDPAGTPTHSGRTKAALILPLSAIGHRSAIAKAMKQAGEMAIFENENRGVELIVKDSKGTAAGASAAASAAIKQGAKIILGPLTAKSARAVAPIARTSNVPVIAFSNNATIAGNGLYLLSFLVRPEVERIISFATAQGYRRFAALISKDQYGNVTERAFRDSVARSGGTIVALERYQTTAARLLEPTERLMKAIKTAEASGVTVDAVFLPGGPNTLPNIRPLIDHASLDSRRIKLLGTGGWDHVSLAQNKAFIGGWYPAPDPTGWRNFSRKYSETYKMSPPRIATLAYDAVTIAGRLAALSSGKRITPSQLLVSQGFNGIDGPVRFTSRGLSQRQLGVYEITPHGPRAILQPSSFSGATASRPRPGFSFN